MTKNTSSPILTILIPTRNRAKNLNNTLRRIVRSIEHTKSTDEEVEVVIANNFSSDNTEEIAKNWAEKYSYIKYYKHQEPYPSAEESMFNGVKYCNGEYVWSFGDDDFIHLDAVEKLLSTIKDSGSQFILLNCDILTPDKRKVVQYMRSNKDLVNYDNGIDLFKDFGLISATTTISCLVFKKSEIDIKIFNELSNISSIYSHSVFLFTRFYNKKSSFLSFPILTYMSSRAEDEGSKITAVSKALDRPELYSFSSGIVKLIECASNLTSVSIKEILLFEEIEISKNNWTIKHSILLCFILRFFLQQLKIFLKQNIFQRFSNRRKINSFFQELNEFLMLIEGIEFLSGFEKKLEAIRKNILSIFLIKSKVRKKIRLLKELIDSLENFYLSESIQGKKGSMGVVLLIKSNIPQKILRGR